MNAEMMKEGGEKVTLPREIYILQNLANNKVYVGSSSKIKIRFQSHINALKLGKHPVEDMQRDFDEHGGLFIFYVVDTIQDYEEKNKEYEWMKKLSSYKRESGYNYKDHFKFEK